MKKKFCLFLVVFYLLPALNFTGGSTLYANEDRNASIEKARRLSWDKNYEASTAIYKQILENNPDDVEAAAGLARVLFWQGKHAESLETLDSLLKIFPDNKEALELRKKVQKAKDEYKPFKVRAAWQYLDMSFASNAYGTNLLFSYTKRSKWELRGGFDYINKFGDSAPGYRVGGSYWATPDTILSLDIEFAPKQVVVPRQAYTLEVSQKIFKTLVPSLGYRFADYSTADVHIIMPGATWYFYPRFDLMAKYYLSVSRISGSSLTDHSISTRLSWNLVDPLTLSISYSRTSESFESGSTVNPFGSFSAHHVSAGSKWDIYKGVGLDFAYDYEKRNNGFTVHTYNAGVFYRW